MFANTTPEISTESEVEPATPAKSIMTIPGMGDNNDDERCRRRGWWDWRSKHVETITEHLATARYMADNGFPKRAVHAVVSPEQTSVNRLVDVYVARDTAATVAMNQGVRGGVLVFHGYRTSDDGEQAYTDAVLDGDWNPAPTDSLLSDTVLDTLDPGRDIDGGVWWWLRKNADNWREHVEWSPHFHCLGLSSEFKENKPEQQDDWVCHRMRSLTPFALYEDDGYRDMACSAKHLYTHASFAPGDATPVTTTWFADADEDDVAWFTNDTIESPLAKSTESSINSHTNQYV